MLSDRTLGRWGIGFASLIDQSFGKQYSVIEEEFFQEQTGIQGLFHLPPHLQQVAVKTQQLFDRCHFNQCRYCSLMPRKITYRQALARENQIDHPLLGPLDDLAQANLALAVS